MKLTPSELANLAGLDAGDTDDASAGLPPERNAVSFAVLVERRRAKVGRGRA